MLVGLSPLAFRDGMGIRWATVVQLVFMVLYLGLIAFQMRSREQLRKVIRFPWSIFWVPVALVVGWGPLAVAEATELSKRLPQPEALMGFGMAWGLDIAFPLTLAAAALIVIDLIWLMAAPFRS
jgi:hypothetical protein